jgi:CHAT domain-containing protein
VLAGANTVGKESADPDVGSGWVTASEIMAMDLTATELVVLSACDTGLGMIETGEGVLGLRRAFLYAGASALLVSLHEVPDVAASPFMVAFYRSLKAGRGKLNSLHDAQVGAMARAEAQSGATHPFFWASFVLVGDPH